MRVNPNPDNRKILGSNEDRRTELSERMASILTRDVMKELSAPGPSISNAELDEAEKALGVRFPSDYRKQMLHCNGGIFSDICAFQCANGQKSAIDRLYRIGTDKDSDIVKANGYRKGRLPIGFFAIGPDPYGNEICMDSKSGNVYFWDHDFEANKSQGMTPETAGNYHLIADSFSAFLDCLYGIPASQVEPTEVVRGESANPGMLDEIMKRKGLQIGE